MRSVLFWLAFALLLPQALYVRRTAPRFAAASGPLHATIGSGEQLQLLAIGDSIIAGVGATTLSKALVGQTAAAIAATTGNAVHWQALGVSGYDVAKVRRKLIPRLPTTKVDMIVVSVGVNDVTGLTTLPVWQRELEAFLDELSSHSPNARIAMSGMPPMHGFPLLPQPLRAVLGMRARMFDRVVRAVTVKREMVEYVALDFDPETDKFSDDGYHPSEDSYTVFGQHMAGVLLQRSAADDSA